jgi:DNA-nicking Smr family endonuclease
MGDDKTDAEEGFDSMLEGIERHHHDKIEPSRIRKPPLPLSEIGKRAGTASAAEPLPALADLECETGTILEFRRPGVQKRRFQELRRGQLPVHATLDLHGMTVKSARQQLQRFIRDSLAIGRRTVLIVHGKGRGSPDQQPILKRRVNSWLRQLDCVLAFVSARPVDGGVGAVYVLLRHPRKASAGDD